MFDARDHLTGEWGSVPSRRRGGLTVTRVSMLAYRWTMIHFAKFVLVEFGMVMPAEEVEAVVDAWLARRA